MAVSAAWLARTTRIPGRCFFKGGGGGGGGIHILQTMRQIDVDILLCLYLKPILQHKEQIEEDDQKMLRHLADLTRKDLEKEEAQRQAVRHFCLLVPCTA